MDGITSGNEASEIAQRIGRGAVSITPSDSLRKELDEVSEFFE